MAPRCWPEHPEFVNDAERVAWKALRAQLRDQDVLLHGIRFTDPVDGEVEIDLLVLMPDMGAAVVEVKGGHITYAEGAVRQMRADGPHTIDPAGQAAKEVRALQRFLERQPDWSRGFLRAAWLVAFPQTAPAGDLGPRLRRDLVIGRDDLDDAAGRVYDRLSDPALKRWTPRSGWVDTALDHLLGTVDGAGEIHARTAERLRHVDELTAHQAALLAVIRNVERFEVTGAAGTGKTWMAMEQARLLAKAGERVAFVAYTRGVIDAVKRAMADLPTAQQPAWTGTFFQLGNTWGLHASGAQDADFWNRRGPLDMLEHARTLPAAERFTAFVVDEAQDFSDSWWPALLAAGTDDARIAVFRDDEQAVFTQRRGRPDLPLVPLVLEENLRNARQVVDTFSPLVETGVVSKAGDGFPLEYVRASKAETIEMADAVVAELLEQRGWLPEHVVLLTTCHRHPVQREFGSDKDAYWNSLWDEDAVFYGTVAGFKGLERPAVVLAVDGFHDDIDPRHVLYTGMSRARDLLIVVGDPDVIDGPGRSKVMKRLMHHERKPAAVPE